MRSIRFIFSCFTLLTFSSFGQNEVWSLKMCLDTVALNNITVKQADLDANLADIMKKSSIYAFTPTLNASVSHSFNFGRILDPVSNEFTQSSRQNTGFNGFASLNLFEGMARYYTLQKSNVAYQTQALNKQVVVRNAKLQVLTFYLQVLVNTEMVKLSDQHLSYSKKQYERMLLLIEAGNSVEGDLIEIRSQVAEDNLSKLRAENENSMSYQRLMQVLQIEAGKEFRIDTSASASILKDTTAFSSVDNLPELAITAKQLESAVLDRKIRQASYFPSLAMSAGIGTNYSDSYFVQDPDDPTIFFVPNFPNQVDQNLYQTIGFSVNIPIYNQFRTKADIQRAEIEIKKAELEIETVKWDLISKMQQLTVDIENAKAELEASATLIELSELDFENAEKKFEEGIINYSDLLTKKDRLFQAQSKLIQNKYNYYFKTRIKALYYE